MNLKEVKGGELLGSKEKILKMKCHFCGGEMRKGKTTFTINEKKK